MDEDFGQPIAALSEARAAVERALEALPSSQSPTGARLAHLQMTVGDLSRRADSLLAMMLERDADADLMNAAEELMEFFQGAEARIAAMLNATAG